MGEVRSHITICGSNTVFKVALALYEPTGVRRINALLDTGAQACVMSQRVFPNLSLILRGSHVFL